MGVEEGVVGVLAGLGDGGVEDGLGLVEAGEGLVPDSERGGSIARASALAVTLNLIQGPAGQLPGRRRTGS